ncbi:MAG: adenylyltransferase/cytidyltransferase family protein [Patescibacteria group bacterium]|jgi:FAD synthetase
MEKKVLIFGTFDLLHPGHLSFLKEAGDIGSVVVALTPDALLVTYKGRPAVNPYAVRKRRLERLTWVQEVVSADAIPNTYSILMRVKPEVILLGYDQGHLAKQLTTRIREYHLKIDIVIARPYRASIYRSSLFRVPMIKVKAAV